MNNQIIETTEGNYQETLDSLGDAIFVIDRNLRIVLTNTSLEMWMSDLGLQTELIGEELKEAINFFPDKIFHEYQQVFRTEATHVSIDHIQINEKDYVLETRKIPITKEGKITQVVTVIRDITKRKKAEDALRKSEEKYRTILENIREGYFEINLSGNLVFFNDSLCQILGCNEVELLGKHYKAYIAREYHKDAYQAFNLVFDLQMPSVHVWDIIRKDGKRIHVETSISLITDSGKPTGFRGIIRDITTRKEMEENLQHRLMIEHVISEISTRLVTLSSYDIAIDRSLRDIGSLLLVDRVSLFLFDDTRTQISLTNEWCNEEISSLIDKTQSLPINFFAWIIDQLKFKHAVIVENISPYSFTNDQKQVYLRSRGIKSLLILPVFAGIELVGFFELDYVKKHQEWLERDIASLRVCAELFGNAITRKRAEDDLLFMNKLLKEKVDSKIKELHEQSQQVEIIIDSISHGILVLDSNGRAILTNKQFKDYIKTIFPDFSLPPDWNFAISSGHTFFDTIQTLFLGKKPKSEIIEPIPGLHLQLSINIGFPALGLGALIEIRDVTPFIEFDNLRKRFMSSVSHELRTPVSVINHSINNMLNFEEKLSEERKNRLMDAISRNSRVLSELIEDLLLFSRIDEKRIDLKQDWFNCKDLIEDCVTQMLPRLRAKNIEILMNVDNVVMLFGDQSKIAQILRILLDNAHKYSPMNTKVDILVTEDYIGFYNPESKPGVLIQVKDRGIGIKQNDLPLIFERFFRSEEVSENIPGTGLGLAIAKELTLLHQGEIFVKSKKGEGSTFSVFLPKKNDQLSRT